MVIWYKFCSSTSFSFLFIYFSIMIFFYFFIFLYVYMTARGSKRQLNYGNLLFLLDSNLFSVLSIKDNYFFSTIINHLIPFIFLLLVQFHLFVIISFIFFMEHIFHKIILNIYFAHIHIMCWYKVFSILCTDYMLV